VKAQHFSSIERVVNEQLICSHNYKATGLNTLLNAAWKFFSFEVNEKRQLENGWRAMHPPRRGGQRKITVAAT